MVTAITERYKDSDGYGKKYAAEAQKTSNSVTALYNLYETKRPTETAATHYQRVTTNAKRLQLDITVKSNNTATTE